jgi:DNA-binding transcriptional LysR family regulator
MVKDSLSALAPSEFDVGIYYARHDVPTVFSSKKLFEEEVFPVCSPEYFGGRIVTPSELARERLLIHEDVQKQWMSWSDWLAAFGEKPVLAPGCVTINQYAHLVQLATRGAGVLLAWKHVSDALLEQGDLVRATRESYTFGGAYHVIAPNERRQTLTARAFSEWLFTTVDQTRWRIW